MPHLWIIYQVTDHCEVGIDKEGKLTSVILVASKALTAWNRQESKTLQGMRLHTVSKPYQCNFCAKKTKGFKKVKLMRVMMIYKKELLLASKINKKKVLTESLLKNRRFHEPWKQVFYIVHTCHSRDWLKMTWLHLDVALEGEKRPLKLVSFQFKVSTTSNKNECVNMAAILE